MDSSGRRLRRGARGGPGARVRRGRPDRRRRGLRRRRQGRDPGQPGLPHPGHRRRRAPRGHHRGDRRRRRVGARTWTSVVKLLAIAELQRRRRGRRPRAPGDDPEVAPAGVGARGVQRGLRRVRGRRPADVLRPRRRRRAHRERRARRPRHRRPQPRWRAPAAPASRRTPTVRVLPMGETVTRYHVAIDVDDRAGVLAAVATAFAEHGVSIQTVRQEGRGDDAQLVVVSPPAPPTPSSSATVAAPARHGHRPRGHLGDAGRGRRRVTGQPAPPVARRDRGVPRPARHPRRHPRDHAARGRHPARPVRLAVRADRRRGLAQGRGRQPDRLVQGPRHDRRRSRCALAEGAKAVVCASTGNTSASMAAYAARAGLTPLVLVPEGKIAAGKMAQAIMHGAQVIMVRGNFDDCLRMARELAWHYPVALVNSVNPVRLEGQKTAAFEIVDFLGDAPDFHLLPVGNAGNISAYWLGYRAVRRPRPGHQAAADARLPGRGRGAAGDRRAVPRPGDQGHRDPDRQPGLVEARRGGARRVRRPVRRRHRRRRSWPPSASSPPATASSSSRRRPPASPGCSQDIAQGESYAGSTVVVTVTGHGLKDTATALEGFGPVVDVGGRRRRHGRRRGRRARADLHMTFVAGPVRVSVPATSANLGPGFDSLGLALDLRDELDGRGDRRRAGRRGRRARAPATVAARREPPRGPRRCGPAFDAHGRSRRPGSGCSCRNVIPHARGLGSSSAAIVGGLGAGPGAGRGGATGCSTTRRCSRSPPTSRATPTTSRPAVLRRLRRSPGREATRWYAVPRARRRTASARSSSCRPTPLSTELARGLLPARRAARRRRGQRRPGGAARRRPRPASPEQLLAAPPATTCTRSTGARPCPARSPSSTRCGPTGVPAVVSGAGPTVLAFVADGVPELPVGRRRRWGTAPRAGPRTSSESTGSAYSAV